MAFSSTAPWAEDTSENAFGPVSQPLPFELYYHLRAGYTVNHSFDVPTTGRTTATTPSVSLSTKDAIRT
ncbi:hypothetical protein N7516_006948 [Penicillium verrucosum]|uniref:uncharacterized protein n=1 Tax=Penicillium verrucosum TaxID=60171 RepID=UPI002544E9A3|nr:uncharacterized protein N7516_006948 [Penicillium verrucosum]KAJ5932459.1 hypothetical protein N7516_006948 [Penicillium verrucosum]